MYVEFEPSTYVCMYSSYVATTYVGIAITFEINHSVLEIKTTTTDVSTLSTIGDDRTTLSKTEVNSFKIGMTVEVNYVNPTAGWTVIWLQDAQQENVVLTFSARPDEKALVLNTRKNCYWQTEERPNGYNFTPGVTQNVTFQSMQDYFIIYVNNNDLYHYNYTLPPTSIKSVLVQYRKSGSAAATKLNSVTYKYQ